MVEKLTIREEFLDIDSSPYGRSIRELHGMKIHAYYDRMARFRFDDSVDVLVVYGDRERERAVIRSFMVI